VAAREQELLPVGYVHVVFTMPEAYAATRFFRSISPRIAARLSFRITR
jgi:hypothetical protein